MVYSGGLLCPASSAEAPQSFHKSLIKEYALNHMGTQSFQMSVVKDYTLNHG